MAMTTHNTEALSSGDAGSVATTLRAMCKTSGLTLVTARTGQCGLENGMAAAVVCQHLRSAELVALRKGRKGTTAVHGGLIIIGDPFEFSEPLLRRLVESAGYPWPSRMLGTGDLGSEILLSGLPERGDSPKRDACGDIGIVFCSVTRDLLKLPVVIINGTTPRGLLSAATAATDCQTLSRIERPRGFPEESLIIVTRLPKTVPTGVMPSPASVIIQGVYSGNTALDLRSGKWRPQKTTVRLVSAGPCEAPEAIYINKVRLPNGPESDTFRLLWALAQRSRKGCWTTLKEAARLVDGRADTSGTREHSLKTRLSELRKLVREEFLLKSTDAESLRACYKLLAAIDVEAGDGFVDSQAVPDDVQPLA